MAHPGLYRYPFDKEGEPTLTFVEAIAAARNLEAQLSTLMKRWTWPELALTIIERRPGYVRYQVRRHGEMVGFATVMPFSVDPPKHEPEPSSEGRSGEEKTHSGSD
ncbi:MAG: hypothetical protein WA891_01785 [Acidobacteriaceae bacterium]